MAPLSRPAPGLRRSSGCTVGSSAPFLLSHKKVTDLAGREIELKLTRLA